MAPLDLQPALEPLHDCVEQWCVEQDALEQDLSESLAALEAFQRQLDAWQTKLATEREQLQQDCKRFNDEQAAWRAENASSDEINNQLSAALAERERLREEGLESARRAEQFEEQATESQEKLEQTKRRVTELEETLQSERADMAHQQARWDEDFRRLRGLLAQQAKPAPQPGVAPQPAPAVAEDPVLDSVLAQFGKLRQQHAGRRSGQEK